MSAEDIIKAADSDLINRHQTIIDLFYETGETENSYLLNEMGLIEAELRNRKYKMTFNM
jgi:hypothetical protein